MSERSLDIQNWAGRDYESFGPNFRIDHGNPEYGYGGGTIYALIAEKNGMSSCLGQTEDGQYNIFSDANITITGGVEMDGGTSINIVGANGDVTITAMKGGDIKIKGKNVLIDADENINIHSRKNVRIKGDSSIFFDTPNLATNALLGNLAPRDVTFGGLVFGGTQVGIDKLESAFTGGKLDSIADQAKEATADLQNQVKDIAGNFDSGALQSSLSDATSGLQGALSNFGGF
tara:strand:- start:621 stop:1316 length:696 start_codon:yes stop_codon:yes gene_type:complete